MKKPVFILLFLGFCALSKAQLTILHNATPDINTQTILGGNYAQISNVWTSSGYSFFYDNNLHSNWMLGMNNGLILSTGDVDLAPGPNDDNSAGEALFPHGDAELDLLQQSYGYNEDTITDVANIEFDFTSDILHTATFKYIFASEEYSPGTPDGFYYNDIVAIWVSGPGIVGEKLLNLVPGTDTVVCVFSINPHNNPEYFVDNTDGFYTQYNGYTVPLYAKFSAVGGVTYHIRIKIGDARDQSFDSALFIKNVSTLSVLGVDNTINTPFSIRAYPNPTDGICSIEIDSKHHSSVEITLLDIIGKQITNIYNGNMAVGLTNFKTDISHLPQGVYLLQAKLENRVSTVKIIKT